MTVTTAQNLEIRPLNAAFGAEITGVDLSGPLDAETVAALRQAWLDHQVVFFPEQHLTIDQQVAFARRFGELTAPSAILAPVDEDHREVVAFDSREFREEYVKVGRHHGWHVDITFQATPPAGSVFNIVKLPPVGGATLFASAQAAYDTLSPSIRALLDGLVAIHSFGRPSRAGGGISATGVWEDERVDGGFVEHPVVAVHPETGRKGLFVNPGFTRAIKGLSPRENAALLELLYDHTLDIDNIIQYRWKNGGVGFWDNRAIWHRRADDFDPDAVRIVHRVQLRGSAPTGPDPAERTKNLSHSI
ncbi:TauD/TfdA family dioxygenase [Frankia sp. AgB1.9]|uniref:TauD/TfdA dioxygenase family protein n=1 Tax=unclassified Frankia TaxID=2632575 RepID=UPI0019314333|nr:MULTISPECIES: TauD/TfdA family dioxygenase [unclassified Frankia]MBL7491041.1 TauD/TfdA family dioxygenase [Frankia sp. AgW1.1]MBL7549611.1 TauD/TfdA family dioxygenase [Frankia sp. AgB1.9]MBL7620408.1 TauD/TfdA family dioxygenase [Frankia sp. AgB1.8]